MRPGKSIHAGIPRAKFAEMELVLSCARSGEAFPRMFYPNDVRIGWGTLNCEIQKSSNSRKRIRHTSVGAIKKLMGKKLSPRICQSWWVSGSILARYFPELEDYFGTPFPIDCLPKS
jgi:hypothetical protein